MTDPYPSENAVISDCLKTVSLDGSLMSMDEDGLCVMEIEDFGAVAGQPWASFWPAESQGLVLNSIQQAANGKVARFSADCPTAKGTMKSWDVSVTPIRDGAGQIVALQSLSQDVTQRERDWREATLVSRELAHRIKNLFAMVDSLIHLSSRSHRDALPFIATLRERLAGLGRAISFIHPMAEREGVVAPRTLKGLIAALLSPYESGGASIIVEGDDVDLGQDAVTSLAMVLNELATNAVKYGALKNDRGRLTVRLTRGPQSMVIDWRESGAPAEGPAGDPGFGATLLDRTVRYQLSGSINRDWSPDGLGVRLDLPLSRLA